MGRILLIKHWGDFADRNTGGERTAYSSAGPKIRAVGKYANRDTQKSAAGNHHQTDKTVTVHS